MNQAVTMGVRQRLRDLAPVSKHIFKRQLVGFNQRAQGPAVHVLHHKIGQSIGLSHFVDCANVRMIELRCSLRFATQPDLTINHVTRDNLQRYDAFEVDIAGGVDDAHPADAEQMPD